MTDRALRLLEDNRYRLDYALEAAPEQESVQKAAATVYEERADAEGCLMATNIFL